MAVRYYDDALIYKIKKWIPEKSNIRVLKPDESKRFFELNADDTKDRPFQLPLISLSRDTDIQLLSNIKQLRSFNGLNTRSGFDYTEQLNIIPIKLGYRLDIYTKTVDEGDEYLRTFLFKLINNPVICIQIPYNGSHLEHKANIRVLDSVSDTSTISERLFSGQFQRWTIQMELQDAFLFNIQYRENWRLLNFDDDVVISGKAAPEAIDLYEASRKDAFIVGIQENDFVGKESIDLNKMIMYEGIECVQDINAPISEQVEAIDYEKFNINKNES